MKRKIKLKQNGTRGLKLYSQSATPEGSVTPTGQSNHFDNNMSGLQEDDLYNIANSFHFRTDNNQNFQTDLYQYMQGNHPDVVQQMWGKYGPDNAKSFADNNLGGRTHFLLDQLRKPQPPQPEAPVQQPASAFRGEPIYRGNQLIGLAKYPDRNSKAVADPGSLNTGYQNVQFMYTKPNSSDPDMARGTYSIPSDQWNNTIGPSRALTADQFSFIDQHAPSNAMKQNAGQVGDMSDVYDGSMQLLQQYMDRQQQSNLAQGDQQDDDMTAYDPSSQDDGSQSAAPQQDFSIPDDGYFNQKKFEISGQDPMIEQMSDLHEQMLNMQNQQEQMMYLLMNSDNGNDNDNDSNSEDDDDSDDGSSYYNAEMPGLSHRGNTNTAPDAPTATMAVRHNNPGNIKYGDFAKGFGAIQGDRSTAGDYYARFPSILQGLNAQRALLKGSGYADLSVGEAMNRWVTGDPNQKGAYSDEAVKRFGNKKMKDLSDSELHELQNFQIKHEDINMSKKLGLKQHGGTVPVAMHPMAKFMGLNNPDMGEQMVIKNKGKNIYRGLDDDTPVHITDENGYSNVLMGPEHTDTFYGNVYERKLK